MAVVWVRAFIVEATVSTHRVVGRGLNARALGNGAEAPAAVVGESDRQHRRDLELCRAALKIDVGESLSAGRAGRGKASGRCGIHRAREPTIDAVLVFECHERQWIVRVRESDQAGLGLVARQPTWKCSYGGEHGCILAPARIGNDAVFDDSTGCVCDKPAAFAPSQADRLTSIGQDTSATNLARSEFSKNSGSDVLHGRLRVV